MTYEEWIVNNDSVTLWKTVEGQYWVMRVEEPIQALFQILVEERESIEYRLGISMRDLFDHQDEVNSEMPVKVGIKEIWGSFISSEEGDTTFGEEIQEALKWRLPVLIAE